MFFNKTIAFSGVKFSPLIKSINTASLNIPIAGTFENLFLLRR